MSEEAGKYEAGDKTPKPEVEAAPKKLIAACPCGKIPTALMVEVQGKYGNVFGDCCGMWIIEFRNAHSKDPAITSNRAEAAWEAAPRGRSRWKLSISVTH